MDPVLARLLWSALLGLAVGIVLGVLLAAMGKRQKLEREQRRALRASFRYALEGGDENALEELARAAGHQRVGIETQLALGALLRRKGDLAGAIRLHEKLLLSPALAAEQRRAAAYELALDFRRSGMIARARELLEALVREQPDHREALRELRELAEERGDWQAALGAHRRLESLVGASPSVRAHLHAARSRALLSSGEVEEAEVEARAALEADGSCAASHLARGEIALARGSYEEAIASLRAALELRIELVGEIQPRLEEAFAASDSASGLGLYLAERLRERPDDAGLRLALARHLRARGLVREAVDCLRELLQRQPELVEPRQELGRLLLEAGTAEELKAELSAVLTAFGTPRRPFSCQRCEVELATFSFRCPRCHAWDTVFANPPAPAPIGRTRATGT